MSGVEAKFDINSVVHLNNFVFLVFSYCTFKVYNTDNCKDNTHDTFLKWIFYGNLSVYGIIFIISILYYINLLDKICNKCGAVCVTI